MTDEPTVYVNDNPIGKTEVYHGRRYHASNVPGWRDDYTRETTPSEAVAEGLRPCKVCDPPTPEDYAVDACPACGVVGEVNVEKAPLGYRVCRGTACRVRVYKEGPT